MPFAFKVIGQGDTQESVKGYAAKGRTGLCFRIQIFGKTDGNHMNGKVDGGSLDGLGGFSVCHGFTLFLLVTLTDTILIP